MMNEDSQRKVINRHHHIQHVLSALLRRSLQSLPRYNEEIEEMKNFVFSAFPISRFSRFRLNKTFDIIIYFVLLLLFFFTSSRERSLGTDFLVVHLNHVL